jgi:hypothetical protein
MEITGNQTYFYSINVQTRQKEYFKLIQAESVYNEHQQDTLYYNCKVKRCTIEKTREFLVPENDHTRDYYTMEEFEVKVNKQKPRTIQFPSGDWIHKLELTGNIIQKRKP